MASKRFQNGSEEWQMINDFLRLLQQFWEVESSDSNYWQEMIDKCCEFREKYKDFDEVFATTFSLAFIDYLDEKARGVKRLEEKKGGVGNA